MGRKRMFSDIRALQELVGHYDAMTLQGGTGVAVTGQSAPEKAFLGSQYFKTEEAELVRVAARMSCRLVPGTAQTLLTLRSARKSPLMPIIGTSLPELVPKLALTVCIVPCLVSARFSPCPSPAAWSKMFRVDFT